MDEMNVQAVDVRHKLRPGIKFCLGLAPVIARCPVAHERLRSFKLYALGPIADCFRIGPARSDKAAAQIDQGRLRDVRTEWADRI